MFLPLQGGGQEGDGVFVGVPLCPAADLWDTISFAKGDEGGFEKDWQQGEREAFHDRIIKDWFRLFGGHRTYI